MAKAWIRPRDIPRTGDDTPARSLLRYVWRMSGRHQIWMCLLAGLVAVLSMVPLELQRRLVDEVIVDRNLSLLVVLGGVYLAVLLAQGGCKLALRLYQSWLSESAIRYNREHLAQIHECRATGAGTTAQGDAKGQAVAVIGTETDRLGGFVGEGLSQPVVSGGMLIAIVGYMTIVEPLVAAVSLIFLVPQIVLVPVVQRFINRLIEERVTMIRSLSDSLAELPQDYGNLSTDLSGQFDDIYANRMRMFLFKFGLKALVNLLNALAPLSVLLVGGYLVIEGETTIGVIVAFISGFERLSAPLRELIAYYRVAAQANVQHSMIARWMYPAAGN